MPSPEWPGAAPDARLVTNLHPDPRLRGAVEILQARAGQRHQRADYAEGQNVYSHVHADARIAEHDDGNELIVQGTSSKNAVYVCPGGRDGQVRLRMRPGRTYTFAATLRLDAPLIGVLHPDARRIAVDWVVGGATVAGAARSAAAANLAGTTRLTVTFTVPQAATEGWIRLVCGAPSGGGATAWSRLSLTETPGPVGFFDGDAVDDAVDDRRHELAWSGAPNASPSVRTLRMPADSTTAERWLTHAVAERDVPDVTALLASGYQFPEPLDRSARALLAEVDGDVPTARRLLTASIAADPDDVSTRLRLAKLAARRSDWRRVIDLLTPTLDLTGDPTPYYDLARAYARTREIDAAKAVSVRAIEHDPALAPEVSRAILDSGNAQRPLARAAVWSLTAARLDEIRSRALATLDQVKARRARVFTYWAQGRAAAPPLVQICLARMAELYGDELVVLGRDDLRYWVDLPPHWWRRVVDNHTHFSDLLRIELLKQYGGVWLDATCWLAERVPDLDSLSPDADFAAFRNAPTRIASWFMAARGSSYIVHVLAAALEIYWEGHDELIDYFLLHHTFEALIHLDDRFAAEWSRTAVLDDVLPHAMQNVMFDEVDAATFEEMRAACFVHKLTLKTHYGKAITSDSLVSALVRRDLGAR